MCFDDALSVYTNQPNLDPTYPDLLTCLGHVADLYLRDSRSLSGETFVKRIADVMDRRRRVAGGQFDPLEEAACKRTIGKLLAAQRKNQKAEPYLQEALKIRMEKPARTPWTSPSAPRSSRRMSWRPAISRKHERTSSKACGFASRKKEIEDLVITDSLCTQSPNRGGPGQRREALDAMDRAVPARRLLELYLPTLDETAQLAYMKDVDQPRLHMALAQGLAHPEESGISDLGAAWTINGKAVTLDALARQNLLARDPKNAESRQFSQELQEVYSAQASLTYGWTPGRRDRTNQLLNRLSEREANWFRRIGESNRQTSQGGGGSWVELATVRKTLPKDSVLIELIRLQPPRAGKKPSKPSDEPAVYAAWIIPGGHDAPVQMINLGPADVIEAAVAACGARPTRPGEQAALLAWRARAERRVLVTLRKLAELILDPLYPHLAGVKRWYLSPDAVLWLVPWAAAAQGRPLRLRHRKTPDPLPCKWPRPGPAPPTDCLRAVAGDG